MRFFWFALTGVAIATVINADRGGGLGAGAGADLLSPVLWPLAIAAVVACLLSPVVDFFEAAEDSGAGGAIVLVFVLALAVTPGCWRA